MSLKAHDLACTRGHRTLFSELNLELNKGQVLLVEGNNGSGKTSLLKMLTGLRPIDAGEILWDEQNIDKLDDQYRAQIAWLGHSNGIKEDLTAAENLTLARTLAQANNRPINDVLDMVKLRAQKNSLPRQFSAGMKRRLSLARLLMIDCPLWILDEPQASLDKTGIAMFESFLTEHVKEGGMAVMTSHHDVDIDKRYLVKLRLGA